MDVDVKCEYLGRNDGFRLIVNAPSLSLSVEQTIPVEAFQAFLRILKDDAAQMPFLRPETIEAVLFICDAEYRKHITDAGMPYGNIYRNIN